MSLGAVK